jgi:hypothetical protein
MPRPLYLWTKGPDTHWWVTAYAPEVAETLSILGTESRYLGRPIRSLVTRPAALFILPESKLYVKQSVKGEGSKWNALSSYLRYCEVTLVTFSRVYVSHQRSTSLIFMKHAASPRGISLYKFNFLAPMISTWRPSEILKWDRHCSHFMRSTEIVCEIWKEKNYASS